MWESKICISSTREGTYVPSSSSHAALKKNAISLLFPRHFKIFDPRVTTTAAFMVSVLSKSNEITHSLDDTGKRCGKHGTMQLHLTSWFLMFLSFLNAPWVPSRNFSLISMIRYELSSPLTTGSEPYPHIYSFALNKHLRDNERALKEHIMIHTSCGCRLAVML